MYDVLREANREISRHVISVVGVDARFATCYSVAGFGSRAGQVRGEIKIQ